jgi:hypothetical protein
MHLLRVAAAFNIAIRSLGCSAACRLSFGFAVSVPSFCGSLLEHELFFILFLEHEQSSIFYLVFFI